ncbi:MAG: proton-conducting transporter membrane subunit [Gemmatimonadaceae bacterium]|nr:proton-conducting transporter membrane subunit [Gemmatimonadaceae bacterium]
MLFLGCAGKSAQIPLYVWLPDAMAGPTPVSALIHAATMVTAGVYLIVRNAVLIFGARPSPWLVVVLVGALTAVFAATIGLKQWDIKKVLAYSTVSQLGYMFVAVGAGAYTAGIFHLVTHAFFKALLFLGAGAVIHSMHHALHATHRHDDAQDMRNMGGLQGRMPMTVALMWIATLAIAGIPPLAGFFSKDAILSAIAERALESPLAESSLGPVPGRVILWLAYGLGVLTAFMTAVYMTRLMRYTFHGRFRSGDDVAAAVHDAPWLLRAPLLVLGALTLVGGWLQLPEVLPIGRTGWLADWLSPVSAGATTLLAGSGHLSHNTEYVLIGVAIAVAVAGIAFAFLRLAPDALTTKDEAPAEQGIGRVLANDYFVRYTPSRAASSHRRSRRARKVLWRGLDLGLINGVLRSREVRTRCAPCRPSRRARRSDSPAATCGRSSSVPSRWSGSSSCGRASDRLPHGRRLRTPVVGAARRCWACRWSDPCSSGCSLATLMQVARASRGTSRSVCWP